MATNSREEPKRYRIEHINDMLEIPEDKFEAFIEDLRSYYHFCKPLAGLMEEMVKAGIPNAQVKVLPTHMTWIDDGKHDATIHLVTPTKPKEPEHQVTRFEVIDGSGRVLTKEDVNVELSYQDDGRTLKVFVSDREQQGGEN